jgi:hypothetical protein
VQYGEIGEAGTWDSSRSGRSESRWCPVSGGGPHLAVAPIVEEVDQRKAGAAAVQNWQRETRRFHRCSLVVAAHEVNGLYTVDGQTRMAGSGARERRALTAS